MQNLEIKITMDDVANWKEFSDRESYFKWIEDWKNDYRALSHEIRMLKSYRKQYQWKYDRHEKDGNRWKTRTKLGDNPLHKNWNYSTEARLLKLRNAAREMLELRLRAKWISRIMRDQKIAA